jgi:membrane-associated phospholipid phosphatase
MRTKDLVWLALLIFAALLAIALKHFPYLPGDVICTRLVQSLLPESKRWAQLLSLTAKMPWLLVLIAVTFCLSWVIAVRRAALLSLGSFVGLWWLGEWLGPLIARPRPSPELVQVADSLSGSAFPSIFAFNYASTVGFLAVLAGEKTTGKLRWTTVLVCSSLLFVGWIARVGLAAHWPSDVGLSYVIGFLWVSFLIRFI